MRDGFNPQNFYFADLDLEFGADFGLADFGLANCGFAERRLPPSSEGVWDVGVGVTDLTCEKTAASVTLLRLSIIITFPEPSPSYKIILLSGSFHPIVGVNASMQLKSLSVNTSIFANGNDSLLLFIALTHDAAISKSAMFNNIYQKKKSVH